MSSESEIVLSRDTPATIIPAGDEQTLKAGTTVSISQALGGSVTVRTQGGLYRIAGEDLDALGLSANDGPESSGQSPDKPDASEPFSEDLVWAAMKNCFDPEIPVNVVDLGLIYDLQVGEPDSNDQHAIQVKMTLTAQGCGMGPVIAEDVKKNIESLAHVSDVNVDIVWDPPWTPHMISDEGRQKLGID